MYSLRVPGPHVIMKARPSSLARDPFILFLARTKRHETTHCPESFDPAATAGLRRCTRKRARARNYTELGPPAEAAGRDSPKPPHPPPPEGSKPSGMMAGMMGAMGTAVQAPVNTAALVAEDHL